MGTTTTNYGLYKPSIGETGWGSLVNTALDTIDTKLHSLNAAVMYAHPSGSNSNDGLSWAAAKKDAISCYDALPSTGGTIVIGHQTYWDSANTTNGVWLAGSTDSAYASLPTGWRQAKRIKIMGHGAGAGSFGRFSGTQPSLLCGSTTDNTKPGIWLSGVGTFLMENVDVNQSDSAVAIRIGIDSSTGVARACSQLDFRRVNARTHQTAGLGPTVKIKAAFWVWFQECAFSANEQELNTSDLRANILIDGSASGGGLIFWKDSYTNGGGGLKINSVGANEPASTNIVVDTITQEGTTTGGAVGAPIVWVNTDQVNSGGHVICRSLESSDRSASSDVAVKVDAGVHPDVVVLEGVPDWSGPCRVLATYPNDSILRTTSVAGAGGSGFVKQAVYGSHEGYRRQGGPATVPFLNKASQDTSTWGGKSGGATVTTGKADPFGGTGAARLSSGSLDERQVARFSQTIAVGDWIIGGVWARTVSAARTAGDMSIGSVNAGNNLNSGSSNTLTEGSPFLDNAWHWIWKVGKFTAVGTAATELLLGLRSDSGKSMDYFAPVFLYIPTASALSDSDVYEIGMNLQSFSDSASVGQVSYVRDQNLHIPRGYIEIGNMTGPGAPADNYARIYADTSGGKDRIVVRFATGAVQVIATEP